jgi:hypothetical protein
MKKHRRFLQSSVILFAALTSFGALYLSGNGWISENASRTKAQSKLEQGTNSLVKIENKVKLIEVISSEKTDKSVQLNIKNNSNKVIKAFVLQKNEGQKSFVQLSDENNLTPGKTHLETFRLLPSDTQQKASILAVVFEDNTGQGDPIVIQELLDMRLGEQIQNERIYGYLKKFSTTSENKLLPLMASTKEAIRNLPDDKDASDFMKIGLHNAKENALLDLDRLEMDLRENNEIKIKHRIQHLQLTYEKKAVKNKL